MDTSKVRALISIIFLKISPNFRIRIYFCKPFFKNAHIRFSTLKSKPNFN